MIGSEQFLLESNPTIKLLGNFVGELHFGNRVRFHYLRKEIKDLSIAPKKTLDAGCGRGQLSFWLAKKFPHSSITGIDINPANVQHCRDLSEKQSLTDRLSFHEGDLQDLASTQKYDLIVCIDVLEHIPDFKKAALNLAQNLSKDGTLIIHTPQNGKYMDETFGFRRFLPPHLNHAEHQAPGAGHVHDGLSKEALAFFKATNFNYTFKDTFNSNIMLLHTLFEAYRGKRRYWHFLLTPLLTALSLPQMKTQNDKGGGLQVTVKAKA